MKPISTAFRNSRFARWLPALLIMLIIFWFSSQPNSSLPTFDWADVIVKKSGHVAGYALLALSYWHAFDFKRESRWIAWLLAILYAATDEFHQSFTLGRHPSAWDVLIFDNLGALVSLWLATAYIKRKQPDRTNLVVEKHKL